MSNEKGKPQNARVPIKQTTKTTESGGTKAKVPHKPTSSGSDNGGKK